MRSLDAVDMDRGPLYQLGGFLFESQLNSLLFSTSEEDPVMGIPVYNS